MPQMLRFSSVSSCVQTVAVVTLATLAVWETQEAQASASSQSPAQEAAIVKLTPPATPLLVDGEGLFSDERSPKMKERSHQGSEYQALRWLYLNAIAWLYLA